MLGRMGSALLVLAAANTSAYPAVGVSWLLLGTASYLCATRAGEFSVRGEPLRGPDLSGDGRLLDVGCGRCAVPLWRPSSCSMAGRLA